MTDAGSRTRTLRFKGPQANAALLRLESELAQLHAINRFELNDKQLTLHYAFPAITIDALIQCIQAQLGHDCLSLWQRGYFFIISYMEHNEKDHLEQPAGWQHDIRHIYAHYFERRKHKQAAYKKLWQRYDGK